MLSALRPLYRIMGILAGLAALAGQFWIVLDGKVEAAWWRSLADLLSYFTIQSNLLIVAWFTLALALGQRWKSRFPEGIRLAILSYATVTMVVFWLVLWPSYHPTEPIAFWANLFLHLVMPLLLWLDLLVQLPRHRLPKRSTLAIAAFPLAYGVYSLIRGSVLDWYPYFFVDPRVLGGVIPVLGMVALAFLVFAGLGLLLRLVNNCLASRRTAATIKV